MPDLGSIPDTITILQPLPGLAPKHRASRKFVWFKNNKSNKKYNNEGGVDNDSISS